MAKPKTILIASANTHKIEELEQILLPLGIELKSARDFPGGEEVVEDKPGLEGNALKKARYWHQKTGLPALADDTGLEVDALNGAPGVRSARYAGEKASYAQNLEKLLREMKNRKNRKARFRTVIAFAESEGEYLFEGVCNGEIIRNPKGEKGFGYDPVFVPEGYQKTFAELSSEEKNRISHRARALEKFREFLKS
jgi:XTP/dITP diphosphohydrolase